jgi:hypothetical protein
MHDADKFARVPASGSTDAQPPPSEMLHRFDEEREVAFKSETYVVRDNGAVLRHARPGARRRRLDEFWTFGSIDKHKGYLVICDHVVHQIVATAFHDVRPSAGHVVDHIDTNRHNNRAENLRWVTRLENILLNPITRKRIELVYGSLEAFFANPSALSVPNWDWMRTVTKEEAAHSLARLRRWAEEGKAPTGGTIGDWLFSPRTSLVLAPVKEPRHTPSPTPGIAERERAEEGEAVGQHRSQDHWQARPYADPISTPEPISQDTPSLTPGAFQRRWRTPTEFPQCPETVTETMLDDYLKRLAKGAVFARNRYGESTIFEADKASNGTLSIVCNTTSGIKDWSLAKVYLEQGLVCHESGGTFFTREGAMKQHLRALGMPFDEALYESIDDYA